MSVELRTEIGKNPICNGCTNKAKEGKGFGTSINEFFNAMDYGGVQNPFYPLCQAARLFPGTRGYYAGYARSTSSIPTLFINRENGTSTVECTRHSPTIAQIWKDLGVAIGRSVRGLEEKLHPE